MLFQPFINPSKQLANRAVMAPMTEAELKCN